MDGDKSSGGEIMDGDKSSSIPRLQDLQARLDAEKGKKEALRREQLFEAKQSLTEERARLEKFLISEKGGGGSDKGGAKNEKHDGDINGKVADKRGSSSSSSSSANKYSHAPEKQHSTRRQQRDDSFDNKGGVGVKHVNNKSLLQIPTSYGSSSSGVRGGSGLQSEEAERVVAQARNEWSEEAERVVAQARNDGLAGDVIPMKPESPDSPEVTVDMIDAALGMLEDSDD
mmetsp:Transcript_2549/g.3891  ORF Transcript_2549/g.3891 Transcript_2549/m.3891 type:complete len:229 (+) Transcript_2549:626-1312(+)